METTTEGDLGVAQVRSPPLRDQAEAGGDLQAARDDAGRGHGSRKDRTQGHAPAQTATGSGDLARRVCAVIDVSARLRTDSATQVDGEGHERREPAGSAQ